MKRNKSTKEVEEINKIKESIENERDVREKVYDKYHKASNVTLGIEMVLISLGIGLNVSGVGLLSTIVAPPNIVPLKVLRTVLGSAGLGVKFIQSD